MPSTLDKHILDTITFYRYTSTARSSIDEAARILNERTFH
jgi:hypothetical protein